MEVMHWLGIQQRLWWIMHTCCCHRLVVARLDCRLNLRLVATAQPKSIVAIARHSTPDSRGAASRAPLPIRQISSICYHLFESRWLDQPFEIFGLTWCTFIGLGFPTHPLNVHFESDADWKLSTISHLDTVRSDPMFTERASSAPPAYHIWTSYPIPFQSH